MPAAELSLARQAIRVAHGDGSWVALPAFPLREFPHRFFMVKRGARPRDLGDLKGARVGVGDWAATGATWARVAIAEAGVPVESIRWSVGGVERPLGTPAAVPEGLPRDTAVAAIPPDRSLRGMLIEGELDCVFGIFHSLPADGPIVRLFRDFVSVEAAYFERARIYPAVHVVCVRREVLARDPSIAGGLFSALEQSRLLWQRRLELYHGGTPWSLADVERTRAHMWNDWQPGGVDAARPMLEALMERQALDGLVPRRLEVSDLFAEFLRSLENATQTRV
jgi:4,5-dihydroxyphthalate decarboxylase